MCRPHLENTAPLRCTGVHAGYAGREVLHGVRLRVAAGEHVAVLGANGSGKTTLLRVLDGGLSPDAGLVELEGRPLRQYSSRERARRIAVVPQTLASMPGLRVRELVLLGRYPHLPWWGGYTAEDAAAAEAAMRMTAVLPLKDRPVDELSGGEVRRVLLARALAQGGRVLLLDELAAGLDLSAMVMLFDLLERRRQEGLALVSVIHDVNLAALYATRLVGLKDGNVLFDGPVGAVFTEENLGELYGARMRVGRHPRLPVPQMFLDGGPDCPPRARGGPDRP
ncbi:MAG: ABC transporter ATP-binding protein [Desulfovibrionaceae bacterium]|nr:ABC transporter ATP-binding protein [Desulfovibrionaceae bacterium]